MKYITFSATTYRGDKKIDTIYGGKVITNNTEEYNRVDTITWGNLQEYYYKYGTYLPFTYYNFRKGKIISFFCFNLFKKYTWDIRQSKYSNLDITVKWTYREIVDFSLEDILKYRDAKIATQFLQERGLK